jgi:hypothetical protein
MADLSKVSIGIKTLLRDQALYNAIQAIRDTLPCKMIIADDGEMTEEKDGIYADLEREGHTVIICDFDKGFGYKSNKIVEALKTDFLLVAADDFDFRPPNVKEGIEKLADVLEKTDMDVASGRVFGAYEFDLEIQNRPDGGFNVIEHRVNTNINPEPWFIECSLTVNYSLYKKRVFEKVRWDDGAKIQQGEHGAHFFDIKQNNFKVCYVPNVGIKEQLNVGSPRYQEFRRRGGAERSCFVKRNIKRYVLGSGQIDYEEKT